MARPKKKPFFDPDREMEALIDQVATEYGVYDDLTYDGMPGFYGKPSHTPSLNEVSRKFGLNVLKVRKLLITAGAFSTKTSRMVQTLHDSGTPVGKIMEKTGLSRASVHSYIPYEKVAYRLNETSPNADRLRLYRERKRAVEELSEEMGKNSLDRKKRCFWKAVELFEGYWFGGAESGRYRYVVRDDGLHVLCKEGSVLSREMVDAAFEVAVNVAEGCKRKTTGVGYPDYLDPIFERLGVMDKNRGFPKVGDA